MAAVAPGPPEAATAARRVNAIRLQLEAASALDAQVEAGLERVAVAAVAAAANGGAAVSREFWVDGGYSVILPEKLSDPKSWKVRRNARSPMRLVDHYQEGHIDTLHDNFAHAVAAHASRPALGTRVQGADGAISGPYTWTTYAEAGELRSALGSGLVHLGVKPEAKVGIYMVNRAEWLIAEQACNSYSMVTVPLYDTLGPNVVTYICNHAELAAVVCSREKLDLMLGCLAETPTVRVVVVVGGLDQAAAEQASSARAIVVAYEEVMRLGRANPHPHCPPRRDALATIMYTSGTTGTPKGVMLTHANMVANGAGTDVMVDLNADDVYISYLPLAHIFERLNVVNAIHAGGAVGFYQGDILKLLEDIQELKPTIFASVPRLWNRIYDKIMATVKASGGLRQRLFYTAFNAKKQAMERGLKPSPVWDRLVFSKMRQALGGRTRILITGASPISAQVFAFMRVCFGGRVIEGYGMTETACAIALTEADDMTTGHVGPPLPCIEVKLDDAPEMDYRSSDTPHPRGEICVRGPCVFPGYYKDPQETSQAFDADGWFHTGDVGLWLPGGQLKIIDRKKNIFKLAQGEYIAPEKIENSYARSPLVMQVFVYGDSLSAHLVAVVVPDAEALVAWAKQRGIPNADEVATLVRNPSVKEAIFESMRQAADKAQLRGFEQVKDIHLVDEPFTVENGLLTPTFKVKRPTARAHFQEAIDAMYARIPDSTVN